ncbi:MAG TPA: HlyD family efflux transporter periplasmic adaptor subunit [Bacteroidales bacterium]|nr:HlyD family efflux transporter periplasmic adaptor subunit [Bacteroidales bacterium]HQH18597.1 HlyD family efflux transporter periplasmic adaptor subunit [Bacteroidales bacterium]HQI45553.1 HlyD family efflux transporter periplasmic adaptor subunit [Bacteroidales bacterium]
MKSNILFLVVIVLLASCKNNKNGSDAFGTFEATETTISSESAGKIQWIKIEEGQVLNAGDTIALVDTVQLSLKREALLAQQKAASNKANYILAQVKVIEEQIKTSLVEKNRLEKLFKDGAATQQQLDNINGLLAVYEKQISTIETQNAPVINELEAYDKQIAQLTDQINRSYVVNPVSGTVLTKYSEANEIVNQGKALYKIADLNDIFLRAYVSGAQLPNIKLEQKVNVLADKNESELKEYEGVVTWISSTAEFTPKIIQTKEERVNLVYAVKVKVKNDGTLKIGMPGEVKF